MVQKSQPNDVWATGAAYEPYVGRWSRLVAREFLGCLGVAPAKQWLDSGQGPAPTYAMTLSEDKRVALREEIRTNLPIATDGSIHLIARAWAICGISRL